MHRTNGFMNFRLVNINFTRGKKNEKKSNPKNQNKTNDIFILNGFNFLRTLKYGET